MVHFILQCVWQAPVEPLSCLLMPQGTADYTNSLWTAAALPLLFTFPYLTQHPYHPAVRHIYPMRTKTSTHSDPSRLFTEPQLTRKNMCFNIGALKVTHVGRLISSRVGENKHEMCRRKPDGGGSFPLKVNCAAVDILEDIYWRIYSD